MRKLILQMNVSLDGFADHQVAIADDELHDFAADMLDTVDIAMFGRTTYELMASYWPHTREDPAATKSMIAFADKFNAIPKIVFSNTLQEAGWENTRIIRGDAVEQVKKLKLQSGKDLSIGGLRISQDFMKHGLIDEYWLLVQPLLWLKGRQLFHGLTDRSTLTLLDTITFKSGVVVLHYRS